MCEKKSAETIKLQTENGGDVTVPACATKGCPCFEKAQKMKAVKAPQIAPNQQWNNAIKNEFSNYFAELNGQPVVENAEVSEDATVEGRMGSLVQPYLDHFNTVNAKNGPSV